MKAARWIIVNVFWLVIWIIKTALVLLWKGLVLFTALIVSNIVANRNQSDKGRYN